MTSRRHFPPPWSVEDIGGCSVVKPMIAFQLLLRLERVPRLAQELQTNYQLSGVHLTGDEGPPHCT